jgi:hypothetical protein
MKDDVVASEERKRSAGDVLRSLSLMRPKVSFEGRRFGSRESLHLERGAISRSRERSKDRLDAKACVTGQAFEEHLLVRSPLTDQGGANINPCLRRKMTPLPQDEAVRNFLSAKSRSIRSATDTCCSKRPSRDEAASKAQPQPLGKQKIRYPLCAA